MLHSYLPIYLIALELQWFRSECAYWKRADTPRKMWPQDAARFQALLETIHRECSHYNLTDTSDMAQRIIDEMTGSETYVDVLPHLDHLNGSLSNLLKKEAVFRVSPESKRYYERENLFGPKVTHAFPSCERDIRKAGSCYALSQEDACVHHLMMVLERGLRALAKTVGVSPFHHTNWQAVLNKIENQLNSLPGGAQLDFYREVHAQFGFLKVAYRNHSEHAHDDPYDMEKALSIFIHVRDFMQALEKGGVSE